MKIIVTRCNGEHEVLTLTEPITIVRGEILNRIVCSTGAEHFFDQDGVYDGWGMAFPESVPAVVAEAVFNQTEKDREIKP